MGRRVLVWAGVSGLACSFNATGVSATGNVDGGADSSSSSSGGASDASSGPSPTSGGSTVCEPGSVEACTCGSVEGQHTCASDGAGFGACECMGGEATSDPATSDPSTTAVDPDTTSPGTTGGESSATSSGTTGGESSTTSDETTGGLVCIEPDPEPNDDEGSAAPATAKKCKQLISQVTGVLAGTADVDWWTYTGTWGNGCGNGTPRPSHTLISAPGLRMCVYLDCSINDAPELFDCGDGTPDVSPEGVDGCCVDGGNLNFEFSCVGEEHDARILLRVDSAPLAVCHPYSVTYTYNDD
ncbi:MAG: hypothetical protein JNL82_31770 [Myxococcales bacterium]|nr:hypothetical protein [Myxococcales bacterium]